MYRLTVDNVENYMCVMRNVFSGHLKVGKKFLWNQSIHWVLFRCTRNMTWKGQQWTGRQVRKRNWKRNQRLRWTEIIWMRWHIWFFRTMTLWKIKWRWLLEKRQRASWWKPSQQMSNSSSSEWAILMLSSPSSEWAILGKGWSYYPFCFSGMTSWITPCCLAFMTLRYWQNEFWDTK